MTASPRFGLPVPGWLIALSLAFCFGVGASVVGAAAIPAVVAPAAVGIMLLVVLVSRLNRHDTAARRRLTLWTLGSFAVHLVIGLAINSSASAVTYLGGDAFQYHRGAAEIVARWHGAPWHVVIPPGKEGFYYLLAGLYYVFGAHQVAGLAVNAALSAALIPISTDLTDRMFGERAARYVAPLFLLMPGFLVWTSQLLREAPTLFFLTLALSCAVRLTERTSVGALIVLSLSLVLLFTFRANVALVGAAGIIAGVTLGRARVVGAVGTGIATLSLTATLILAVGVGYSGYALSSKANLRQVDYIRSSLGTSASGYAASVDVSTPGHAISYLPRGVTNYLLGPFPWQVHGLRQLPALVDVLCVWALLPSAVRGLSAARRLVGRRMLVFLLPFGGLAVTLALFLGNFGTIVRERLQVTVVLVPFIALGLARRHGVEALGESEAEHEAGAELARL